jgi:sulfoxide reductase heme-binding subunit YedZ
MFYEGGRVLNRDQSQAEIPAQSSAFQRLRKATSFVIRCRWATAIVIGFSFAPAIVFMWQVRNLDAGEGAFVTGQTGDWTLIFLILTLAITPIRRVLGLPDLVRFRRTLGLSAFFYGCLHVAAWHVFKHGHKQEIGFLTIWSLRIGFLGFALMVPLAVTSTDRWIRWLGGKRWRALHSLVYLSAVAGIVHYCLLPNIALWKVLAFSATTTLLILLRIRRAILHAQERGQYPPSDLKSNRRNRDISVAQRE